jgi:phycobilisome core-membrane linker protein
MNHYYDLCSKKGFYALIDEILDSDEYLATFGEDTVPYERYLTPKGWSRRSLPEPINWLQAQLNRQTTAGQVVAQKIREDRDRQARLSNKNNRSVSHETGQVKPSKEEINNKAKESGVVTNSNSTSVEQAPELVAIEEKPQAEKSYEYSQTTDS